jgi:heme exporter protein CcmD
MSGFYIWGAYAVTFAALALEVVLLVRRNRKCRRSDALPADKMTK